MVGARRTERAEARLSATEAEYRVLLIAALEQCAAGVWGLFGQNAHSQWQGGAADAETLCELADEIDAARSRLGMESFALHARFLSLRGRSSQNLPGEPKLAREWLTELGVEAQPGSPHSRG